MKTIDPKTVKIPPKGELEALEAWDKFQRFLNSYENYLIARTIYETEIKIYDECSWLSKFLGLVDLPDAFRYKRRVGAIEKLDIKTKRIAEMNGWMEEYHKLLDRYGFEEKGAK